MHNREARKVTDNDGRVLATAEYVDGVLDGVSRVFLPSGTLVVEMHFSAGEMHGAYRSWWDNRVLKEQGNYANGKRVGEYLWFKDDGTLWTSHVYPE